MTTVFPDDPTPLARAAEEHVSLARKVESIVQLPRPAQTRVFVVANQKGGVGKTTTTVNLAAAMAIKGLRILVIDLDPQGNTSTALDIVHTEGTPGVYEALVEGESIGTLVQQCPAHESIQVLPASIDLAGAEIELVSLVARETRLDKALQSYLHEAEQKGERYDYVFIDCPPSLGLLTVNALVAGREVLIPIQCEYYALEGLGQLLRNIELVKAHLNPKLNVTTILLTMYDGRTNLSSGVAAEVRQHFGGTVLTTAIPRSVRISEAPSYQQSVVTYDPSSSGALSYIEAAREIAERASGQKREAQR
ncbi:MAG: AAA family ATPase [Aeromicrobium sp.]|uniref:ParA family protein n=1 Tax=Aeromicrobium sp. TaxID=1871063 RepID=UPI0039E24C64